MLSDQFIADLINPGNTNIIPGLERMQRILELLAQPQHKYKVIHITGTNGKGSTAAFLETGLIHAGYKTGKFTSPYITQINECITLDGIMISEADLQSGYVRVKKLLTEHNLFLSPFEFLTVIMFDYFARQQIEWLILEVGMGGKNDATNVVDSAYTIITNVELEHTQWLGNTLSAIAGEKAGIIKNGLPIIADTKPELLNAVSAKTSNFINVIDEYAPDIELDAEDFCTVVVVHDKARKFPAIYPLSLFGRHQAANFLCAYAVFKNLALSDASIRYAAEHTEWAGRLQIIQDDPLVILDATHNAAGAKHLVASLQELFKPEEVVILTSILRDKDIPAILTEFSQLASTIICTSIDNNPRGMAAEELAGLAQGRFEHCFCVRDPIEALAFAETLGRPLILITGSLYLLSYFAD